MLDLEDLLNRKADLEKEGAFLPFAVETANRDIDNEHNKAYNNLNDYKNNKK